MKVVKCTYSNGNDGFTIGKEYEVIGEEHNRFEQIDVEVIDDDGYRSYLLDEEYEVVKEELSKT